LTSLHGSDACRGAEAANVERLASMSHGAVDRALQLGGPRSSQQLRLSPRRAGKRARVLHSIYDTDRYAHTAHTHIDMPRRDWKDVAPESAVDAYALWTSYGLAMDAPTEDLPHRRRFSSAGGHWDTVE
jgi:hypothetical protein